jgi:pimeloyl-ACP methyl ester carboxylesterase
MATFVLVHGGWQGGWSWRRVVPHLRASGHEVYTPTLTGLGERAHLLGCVDGLDTHVKDVLGLIEYEDLEEVMLVGHSYGGVVITAVAEVVAEKLSHLVYLDAWIPKDGQGMFDLMPQERAGGYREAARVSGEGIGIHHHNPSEHSPSLTKRTPAGSPPSSFFNRLRPSRVASSFRARPPGVCYAPTSPARLTRCWHRYSVRSHSEHERREAGATGSCPRGTSRWSRCLES